MIKMPNNGPSDREWWERLRDFAAGNYKFGRGDAPQKGSKWSGYLLKIKQCPLFVNPKAQKNLFGQPVACTCNFHKRQTNLHKLNHIYISSDQ